MIRVHKHPEAPDSLAKRTSWNGKDVEAQLQTDHRGKCYLCERVQITDFQVEHLISRDNSPALTYEWTNLFWSCGYCNGKKSSSFDNLLNPAQENIEDLIRQSIDFPNATAVFASTGQSSAQIDSTIALLGRMYNGTNRLRTLREQRFYDYAMSKITSFQKMVTDWLSDPCQENKEVIIEELDIKSEFLGFKYWIIKSNETLYQTFGDYITWNKQ